ncbi:MAG: tetratricopeptide repeat protein [Verrucomicrobiota bacterium]|nr:tetratricopeptide repeat protein [Verrucomicrobiota bacterium]
MNEHQKPHGRGDDRGRATGLFLALTLVGVLSAATPPLSEVPLPTIEHALQLGNLRQSQPGDRLGMYLPPSVRFLARPPYLDTQDQQAGADIAMLGGARTTWTSAIDYASGRITILSTKTGIFDEHKDTTLPHGFRTGDKVEIFAIGPVPRGLTTRRTGMTKPVYYFIRTNENTTSFYLHKREADAYKASQTVKLLSSGLTDYKLKPGDTLEGIAKVHDIHESSIRQLNKKLNLDWDNLPSGQSIRIREPGQLFFVPQALERRRPPTDDSDAGEPPWEGILRRLKRVLESDATSKVKQEAKGVALLSLALRAQREDEPAVAHRFFDHYARTNRHLPNPPVSLPEVLLAQAQVHHDDGKFSAALEKFYDAQKSLLARPVADERMWQWLNIQAKRGIADTFSADTGGYTEDVRQWAFKMGALEVERTHSTITDTAKVVYKNVVKTSRPHRLRMGTRLRLLPMDFPAHDHTLLATVGIKADQPLFVKLIDDGHGDKFILLDNLEDTHNPAIVSGRLPIMPNKGKLFFLPYTAPASQLVDAVQPNRYTDAQLGLRIYPRLVKLYAAAQLRAQLDTEVDDLQRVFGNLNNTLFAGPRGDDLTEWRREWRRWGKGNIDLNMLANDLRKPILGESSPLVKTPDQLEAEKITEDAWKKSRLLRQTAQPAEEKGAWSVVFTHMQNIFENDSVPTSGIRIDLKRDVLNKRQHGLQTGEPVRFSGPLPTTANVRNLDSASIMFVRVKSLDQFSLHPSATEAVNELNSIDFNGTGPRRFVTLIGIPYEETPVSKALKDLATAAEHEGEFGRALQYLSEYHARNPDSPMVPEALLRQGFLYRLMGQPELAIEKFYETMTDATRLRSRNLLKYRRTTLMAQAQIADTYYADLRQYDEAIKFYEQLLNEPDEELALENTKYKLIRCLVRDAMELKAHAADPAKRRENPLLVGERHQRLTALAQEATRFLVSHPRSRFRSQVRYLRATAYEQLGDEKNADKDFRTLIETPSGENPEENNRWDFWKTKAALDLADRMFDRKRYADAVQVYPVLLSHNPTLDAHIRIHQQIAFCHSHLGNLDKEITAWTRIGDLWHKQEDRLKEQQDILAVLEQQAGDLKDAELEALLERIEKLKKLIAANRNTLTPRLELIAHMARARHQALTFRKQLTPQTTPTAPTALTTTP